MTVTIFYQNVDYLQGLQDATGYSQLLTKTQTTFVKRSKYDCYEDNSMYIYSNLDLELQFSI